MDVAKFQAAVEELEGRFGGALLGDADADAELRSWLDGDEPVIDWTEPGRVTADEWFFISTLYGEMTMEGQRSHIRKYYPALFVDVANRDIRAFVPGMAGYSGLRSSWMSKRLARMGEILRDRGVTMESYASHLRDLERDATPTDPTPALDAIVADHRATGWKTLSVFIRDCVGGNCFPIDSRVSKALARFQLEDDERELVAASLSIGRNPRELARLFYLAGGD